MVVLSGDDDNEDGRLSFDLWLGLSVMLLVWLRFTVSYEAEVLSLLLTILREVVSTVCLLVASSTCGCVTTTCSVC